jgi:hypothetical protein
MTTAMLRVSGETKDAVLRVAQEDFGGASADETVQKLLGEHFQAKTIAAVERYRDEDPEGWREYLGEAERMEAAQAPVTDPWAEA